jgi:hypothetical protein
VESRLNPNAKEFAPIQKPLSAGSIKLSDSSLCLGEKVEGVTKSILVDTGAAATIISNELWKRGRPADRVPEVADDSLQSATGEELKIVGLVNITANGLP